MSLQNSTETLTTVKVMPVEQCVNKEKVVEKESDFIIELKVLVSNSKDEKLPGSDEEI